MNKILGVLGAIMLGGAIAWGVLTMLGATPVILIAAILSGIAGGYFGFNGILGFLNEFDVKSEQKETLRLTHEEFKDVRGLSGINGEELIELVQAARKKLRAIVDVRMRLIDVKETVGLLTLGKLGEDIINEVKRDPKDYRLARSWFNTHLDQTLNIAVKFEQAIKVNQGAKADELAKDFKETIDQLEGSFNKLLDDLRANDLQALKIDMEVLNDQLKLER